MADLLTIDVIFGIALIVVAAIAIYAFIRATKPVDKKEVKVAMDPPKQVTTSQDNHESILKDRLVFPSSDRKFPINDIEKAKSNIRTLTLKQEITSMVLRRLFEAEDEGEISKDERIRLSSTYEEEMKLVAEELKHAELVVSLAELESIREEIIKKFEATLNQTQEKIDTIIKELKIEEPTKEEAEQKQKVTSVQKRRRAAPKPKVVDEALDSLEDIDENNESQTIEGQGDTDNVKQPEARMDVEARLNKLKQEVLKELDELDKLELEA
ncbi:hypothetical protein JW865_03240 [Candidatus Bathyarchaeota archaeon]|nr:hypothetical protein [Candidatus Bathyarchaeota archaeon]